jgi:hypothetical protein
MGCQGPGRGKWPTASCPAAPPAPGGGAPRQNPAPAPGRRAAAAAALLPPALRRRPHGGGSGRAGRFPKRQTHTLRAAKRVAEMNVSRPQGSRHPGGGARASAPAARGHAGRPQCAARAPHAASTGRAPPVKQPNTAASPPPRAPPPLSRCRAPPPLCGRLRRRAPRAARRPLASGPGSSGGGGAGGAAAAVLGPAFRGSGLEEASGAGGPAAAESVGEPSGSAVTWRRRGVGAGQKAEGVGGLIEVGGIAQEKERAPHV